MKMMFVVALALVAAAAAAPQGQYVAASASSAGSPDAKANILRSGFDQQPDGSFVSSFETENGIKQQSTGEVKQIVDEENKPQSVLVVRGSYSYTDTDGKVQSVTYFADETGFHAEGDSIPKAQR